MGTLLAQIGPPKWVPESAPNRLFLFVFEHFWSSTGAPTLCTPKNGPPQVDAKELPRRSHQTFIFKYLFANFVLRDRFDGPSKCALHFQNMQFRIGFIDVLDALAEPTYDHQVNRKKINDPKTNATLHESAPAPKKRAPRCMGTLRRKTERAPRCMGMLFVLLWSSWVPQRRSPQNAPASVF